MSWPRSWISRRQSPTLLSTANRSCHASLTPMRAREPLLLERTVNRFQNPAKRYGSVRTPRLKYIRYNGGFEELFDLKMDPSELNNEAQNPVYASELEKLVKRSSEPLSLFRLRLENFIFVRLLIYKRTRECLTD